MLRDITIGQYYPVDSVIHRLDPRVKLFFVFIYVLSLFLFGNFISYCLATVLLLITIYYSKIPFKFLLRGFKTIFMLLIFTTVMNLFMTDGVVWLKIWKLTITKEGVIVSVHILVRILYLIIASSLLTYTTSPTRLTDALEKVFKPLNKLKVPVHELTMMMSIALRFIPILVEEADKIMKAQSSRCMNFNSGNILKRIKNLMPLFIPLFVAALRRADDLALAMESRCYQGGEGRTKMKVLKYERLDLIVYIVLVIYFILSFLLHILL